MPFIPEIQGYICKSTTTHNQTKNKSLVIISVDAKNAADNIQNSFMIKFLNNFGMEEIHIRPYMTNWQLVSITFNEKFSPTIHGKTKSPLSSESLSLSLSPLFLFLILFFFLPTSRRTIPENIQRIMCGRDWPWTIICKACVPALWPIFPIPE